MGLQTLRAGFSECGVAQCTCWPHRAGVYNCAPGTFHPGQLRGVFFSSVELAVLSACFPSSCTSSRIPKVTFHPARATHHGFWPGVLKRPSGPLPAENGTGAPRVQEYQFTTQPICAFHGLGATCAFVGQIATFVLVEVGREFGCMLKYTMCCSPYTHGEWYLLDSTQLGAELLPLLLENMAFRLNLNLVQIQAVVQGLTFAVPLVSFLVDWLVGTVFIAVAFPSFEHMVEARSWSGLTLVGASVLSIRLMGCSLSISQSIQCCRS